MLTDEQKNKFSSLKLEIIDINILAHCFVRKFNRLGYIFQNSTRHHIYEEFVALRYIAFLGKMRYNVTDTHSGG